jgi:tetratricopeptide (TPR) repeat protein
MLLKTTSSAILLTLISFLSFAQEKKLSKEEIIDKYLKKGAWYYGLDSQEWQQKIDEGLKLDSTIAYLWQQKAIAMIFQMKYSEGIKYLNKAVEFDSDKWLEYRAFINCIYVKDYPAAIRDFDEAKKINENRYVMDHSYNYFLALSYLQLNQFKKSEELMDADIRKAVGPHGEDYAHYLGYFYLAIAKLEQGRYEDSIVDFERSLRVYEHFSDAKYYKAIALSKLWKVEEAKKLFEEAKADFNAGYTINDEHVKHERYPYQVNWKLR